MTTKDYTYLLNKPYSVTNRQGAELESILTEFPYLQSARAIYLKELYNKDSFRYNTELKKTAAYTTDRSVLFEFITTEAFRSIGLKQLEEEETALAGIEVIESTPTLPVIEAVPTIDKLEESIKLSIIEAEPEEEISIPEPAITIQDATKLEESIKLSIIEAEPEEETTVNDTEIATPAAEDTVINQNDITISETDVAINNQNSATIGSPLKFDVAETHSFAEWLQLSRIAPVKREEPQKPAPQVSAPIDQPIETGKDEPETIVQPGELNRKLELIDRFIEINPKIKPVKSDTSAWENLSKNTADSPGLMTETLARVYLEQKKYTKAIQAYEILILKYPEKSAFFADRISEIKDLQ
ncbi:tetratricopeptide repeat protein [Flavobacterium psychrotrophum]|uniref:tetratricopeptide repeat protein n=1 Tax=Flavobacterium psychrotrophum TaxID=2294119 RepID=UPI000E31A30A|nr:tetratricopeptide repeat protein [Flavobacterium psychrotrophum]